MQQAVNDYNVVDITGGTYVISDTITVPPRRTINGGTFKIVGQPSGAIGASDPLKWNAFEFQSGHDVILRDMIFIGENTPFDGQYVQNQCSILNFPNTNHYRNIVIERCTFQSLYGFPLNGSIKAQSCLIADNTAIECGNGFNINCAGVIYRNNTLTDAEGIECSGDAALIEYNTLIGGLGGITLGGKTSPTPVYAQVARYNTIRNTGNGIAVSSMSHNTIVSHNTIENVNNGIIVNAPTNGTWTDGVIVRNNTIDTVTQSAPNVGGSGLSANATDVRNTTFDNNTVTNAVFGAQVRASTTTLQNNYLRGSNVDLLIQSGIEDTVLTDNDYLTCSGCE